MKKMALCSLILSLQYFVIVSVFSFEAVAAQGQQTAESLLRDKEAELNHFVRVVEANAHNCDGLADCSGPKTCSRISCYKYGTQCDPNYKCLEVKNNTICPAHYQHLRNFDYTRSFLRLVDKDVKRNVTARTVCTHRTLDDHFKNSSMNDSTHFFRAFFGAVDGTFRIYPGANEPDCSDSVYDPKDRPVYDPRFRPWFVESTYVEKAVAVLIDTGSDMQKPYDIILPGTYLNKAVSMALRLLDTVSVVEGKEDYVNIMAFSGNGIYSWLSTFKKYNTSQHYQNFSDSLDRIVRDTSSDVSSKPSALDTSNSINTAISELKNNISIPENYLKVVIVLTAGTQFQNLSDLNITANSGVNVFVYKFKTDRAAAECSPGPAIRASSEVIPHQGFDNPLYALHSYYSFLAKVHKSFMGNLTDYGPAHQDFSGIDNNTLTLSKAAFDLNGELIGVLGIDFHQKKLDSQYPNIGFQAIVKIASRKPIQFDTKYLSVNVCFTPYILEDHCQRLDTSSVQLFHCQLSTTPGSDKIGCCGDCNKEPLWKKIVGGVVGGVGGLLALAAIVWLIRRWYTKRTGDKEKSDEPADDIFPGTGQGIELQGDTRENRGPNARG